MRILDDKSDKKLDTVTLFLTQEEALQLRSDLDQLLAKPKLHHTHLSSENYQKGVCPFFCVNGFAHTSKPNRLP